MEVWKKLEIEVNWPFFSWIAWPGQDDAEMVASNHSHTGWHAGCNCVMDSRICQLIR